MKPLTVDQLIDGCQKAVSNGGDLLREANILRDAGCHARAAFLAYTALEEFGKAQILTFTAAVDLIDGKEVDWKEFGKDFRSHPIKTLLAHEGLRTELTARLGPNHVPALPQDFDSKKKMVAGFIALRAGSLYVDMNDDRYRSPSEAIKPPVANLMIEMAQVLNEFCQRLPEYIEDRRK